MGNSPSAFTTPFFRQRIGDFSIAHITANRDAGKWVFARWFVVFADGRPATAAFPSASVARFSTAEVRGTPEPAERDVGPEFAEYEQHGVPEHRSTGYWIPRPLRTVSTGASVSSSRNTRCKRNASTRPRYRAASSCVQGSIRRPSPRSDGRWIEFAADRGALAKTTTKSRFVHSTAPVDAVGFQMGMIPSISHEGGIL
jgi:hypothetical protein